MHLLTFFLIFIALMESVVSFYLAQHQKFRQARRLDFVVFAASLVLFILINSWLLYEAYSSEATA
ncbi:MAG: hypothetical protein HC880_07660 [Bacteroidia bacterium]|nr:hypothetical protein [Bacteroidia bacterium]